MHMKVQENLIKSIGGYMPLEIPQGRSYYPELKAVNTGRNALEYIIRVRKYSAIYLPYFTCDVLLEPLQKLGIKIHYYSVDGNLDPIIDFEIDARSCFLYTNYFGIKTETVKWLSSFAKNLIIDNAQAFFSSPMKGIDTFYSCRKFFGVPDGAYVYTSNDIGLSLKTDHSVSRFAHLIKSIDYDIEEGYADYLANNELLSNTEIKKMSVLTQQLLAGVDYAQCANIRVNNFNYLHDHLEKVNNLPINLSHNDVPMVYPLLMEDPTLKEKLIKNKIFVATYWPNVFDWAQKDSYEYFLSENLIALPIDHRYSFQDMRFMLSILNSLL